MNLIGHIVKKDLRQIWPHVLLWMASAVILYVWGRVAPEPLRDGNGFAEFNIYLGGYCLLWLSLFPTIVRTDAAVGTSEFWMTRPVAGKTLFAAKLVEVLIVGVVFALALHGAFLFSQGFDALQVTTALIHFLPTLLCMATVGLFFASQTRGIVQFWALALGLSGSLFLVTRVLRQIPRFAPTGERMMALGEGGFSGRVVAMGIVCGVGSVLVAALQYHYRSRRISVLTSVPFVLSLLAVFFLWKETEPTVVVGPREQLVWNVKRVPWPHPGYSAESLGSFDLRLNPPVGEILRLSEASGKLVWSDQSTPFRKKIFSRNYVGIDAAIRAAMGTDYVLILDPLDVEDRLSLPISSRSGEEVHLLKFEGQIEGERVSMKRIGVVPLSRGASVIKDGCKFEILEIASAPNRFLDVKGIYQCPHYRKAGSGKVLSVFIVLVNESRKEVRILESHGYGGFVSRFPGLDTLNSWWSVGRLWQRGRESPDLDRSWIDGAKLHVFEFSLGNPAAVPVECSLIDPAPSTAVPVEAPAHVGL